MVFQEPKLTTIDGFVVSGLQVRTKNSEEFDSSTARLPKLWQDFFAMANVSKYSAIYSVYSDYESDITGYYNVTVGLPKGLNIAGVDLSTVTVRAGHYLIFNGKGKMPQTVIETWLKVWSFFDSHSDYNRRFISDFELYREDEIDIYIGII